MLSDILKNHKKRTLNADKLKKSSPRNLLLLIKKKKRAGRKILLIQSVLHGGKVTEWYRRADVVQHDCASETMIFLKFS